MSSLAVVGIDPNSKKLALVVTRADEKKPQVITYKLVEGEPDKSTAAAFREICILLYQLREEGYTPVGYIEAPIMGVGGPGATIPQAFVTGSVMAAFGEMECRIHLINNQTWKKRVCGKGNMNKEQIAEAMKDIWPDLYKKCEGDQDLMDAGAINKYGQLHQKMLSRFKSKVA